MFLVFAIKFLFHYTKVFKCLLFFIIIIILSLFFILNSMIVMLHCFLCPASTSNLVLSWAFISPLLGK